MLAVATLAAVTRESTPVGNIDPDPDPIPDSDILQKVLSIMFVCLVFFLFFFFYFLKSFHVPIFKTISKAYFGLV